MRKIEPMTTPLFSLNGNSKEEIREKLFKIDSSINDAIADLITCEYDHRRNSKDATHCSTMKAEKQELINALTTVRSKIFDLKINL